MKLYANILLSTVKNVLCLSVTLAIYSVEGYGYALAQLYFDFCICFKCFHIDHCTKHVKTKSRLSSTKTMFSKHEIKFNC